MPCSTTRQTTASHATKAPRLVCFRASEGLIERGCYDCPTLTLSHRAPQALGAIGAAAGVPTLRRNFELESNDVEIRETCRIALDFCAWQQSGDDKEYNAPAACACMLSAYDSRDPAPAHPAHEPLSHAQVGAILRDSSRPLFERYRAMFSLRNKGGAEAARELGRSLVEDESSALFRHEVA